MKTIKNAFAILFILLLIFSCSNDDDNSEPPVSNEIEGIWVYKSISIKIIYPNETQIYECVDVIGTINFNSNQTYYQIVPDASCTNVENGLFLLLPLSFPITGTYLQDNTSLITTEANGGLITNMTIVELSSNKMKLNLNTTNKDGVITITDYILER